MKIFKYESKDYLKELEVNLAYHFSEILNYPFAKPYWVYISLSHKCTYNCQMCGVVKILKEYEISNREAKNILSDIAKWNWDCVVMFTGGEVFLRKDIFDIFDYAVKKKLWIEAVSNGSLIDKSLASKIVSSGLRNIAISLDGATKETHDSIRQKGSFDQALTALRNLVKAKKGIGSGPQISVWTTIMKENVRELYDFIKLVKNIGVECLVYHPVIVAQDDMQNTSPDAPFWIRGDDIRILKEQLDKITAYQDKHGLVSFLHDPYLWIKHFEGKTSRRDWKCNPFAFINIGPDGEMRSCGAAFGNVKEIGAGECLFTKEAKDARALMKICQKPCLQTCWAYPEADSLEEIIRVFIQKLDKDSSPVNREKALNKAFKLLNRYKQILSNNNA